MTYTLKPEENLKINLAPETVLDEVLQNIAVIISTVKGTVPLYRDFGISSGFVDKPSTVAESLITAEVFDAIEKYEPRAEVLEVTFENETKDDGSRLQDGSRLHGRLFPRLEVKINDG